jgi:hypothetical protein
VKDHDPQQPARPAGAPDGGVPHGNGGARRGFALCDLLGRARPGELMELYQFWSGAPKAALPERADELRARLAAWMSDPVVVEERVASLGKRLGALIEHLVSAPRYQRALPELRTTRELGALTPYDLEACLAALTRRGLLLESEDRTFATYGRRIVGLPSELGDSLVQRRREKRRGLFGALTLRGHLDLAYSDSRASARVTPQRLRELYKMYSQETASVARIERLPEGMRGLVEKAILEFGGLLPRHLFERMESDLPHWNGRRWRMILEQSLVGSVAELDLSRYGIQHQDETLIVFNEVALAYLRRVAVPGDPDRPHEELAAGIDLASNIGRFLAYIEEHDVRFTVQGEIFKTTEKKILQHLIPNPGRELSREEALTFIFRFARAHGLIDRTGQRTFAVTSAGREWAGQPLFEKQRELLEFALAEREALGEPFHHERMRPAFLRLLKRVQIGTWYDLMYLPFLARNAYLSTLDELCVEEHFSERAQNGHIPAMEDPQRLAWNLAKWVRQRLHLLGVVDMGYDRTGRPVALRLTPTGARLLGLDAPGAARVRALGSLVVTPDFEIVLFPTGDDAELVHALDRFCARDKLDALMHFRLGEDSVRRALKEGMGLVEMLDTLETHSRTPVPQNVLFSVRDWAKSAGLMTLSTTLLLACHDSETLRRFLKDPGTRKYVGEMLGTTSVQLKGRVTPRRMQALLRELGYLVELGSAA